MAIAFDSSAGSFQGSTITLTYSHTCTGSNLILLVSVSTVTTNITGVTYNGVSMTQITTVSNTAKNYLFYLIAPTTGTNNVVVSAGGSTLIMSSSSSYTGALQSSQPDAFLATASNTETLSVVNSGCWIVSSSAHNNGGGVTFSAGSGFTLRNQQISSGDGNAIQDTNGVVSTGNNTVSINTSFSTAPTIIGASIKVAPIVYPLTAAVGTFTLTGYATVMVFAHHLIATVGQFTLTGYVTTLAYVKSLWTNTAKTVTTWINESKNV